MIIGPGEIAHREAVPFGRLAKKIDSRHSARAGHVLHDDRGIARNMLREMARDDPPFDVRGPAGSKIDDEVHIFPLVKRPFRRD